MFGRKKYLGIITGDVITAGEDSSALEIAKLMKSNNISVVVILKENRVLGLVSERDIVRAVVSEGRSLETTTAKEFMTREIITVEIKEGLNKIYQTLCEKKFRHLIVLDDQKLVGITSRRDLLDVLTSKR